MKKNRRRQHYLKCFTTINLWIKSTNIEIQVFFPNLDNLKKIKFDVYIYNMFINILKTKIFR